jgi:hypothetical protein
MSTPTLSTGPGSKGQRLAAEATEAAEVRDALTHPDVVALRVEHVRARVDRFIWTGMILGLLFTMTNVQQFTAHTTSSGPGSLGWWAAWLLDPTVSVILLGVLLAEREVSRWRVAMDSWARVAKWGLLAATYVMNTWESYTAGSLAGIVLHSVPVLAVFVGAEALTSCNDALTRAVEVALTKATERADRKARTEREKQAAAERDTPPPAAVPGPVPPAPIGPPAVPAFPTVAAVRPALAPADRPADRSVGGDGNRSADRSAGSDRHSLSDRPSAERTDRTAPARVNRPGPGRKRTGKPRTDAQLSRAVRELAERTGGPPSQYAIKQRFGVGSGRAARLLAELDIDHTPAGAPASNGAATRHQGGTR